MIRKIKAWLLKPYPYLSSVKLKVFTSFSIGFFIFIFLYIFKPFKFTSFASDDERLYYQILYGVITTFVILINFFVLPLVFPNFFNPKKWKTYKEILIYFEILTLIALLNWLFSDYSSFYIDDSYFDFLFFLKATYTVGVIPLSFFIILEGQIFANKQNEIKIPTIIKESSPNQITLKGENKNEIFTIEPKNLLYISSEKNYSSIFYLENGKIKEKLIRSSLNKIERQLKPYNMVFRCHKSFIVNVSNIEKFTGNSHRYNFVLKNVSDILIPISRKFSKKELEKLLK